MNLLALDTSTDLASVVVWSNGQVYEQQQHGVRQHADAMLTLVERVLQQADLRLSALDGIVFGRGPGSFTGLRVCCSIAKGLAYAHDLPLYPVSGLAAVAQAGFNTDADQPEVLVLMDARMNQVYWAVFTANQWHATERVSDLAVIEPSLPASCRVAVVGFDASWALPSAWMQQVKRVEHMSLHARLLLPAVVQGRVAAVSVEAACPVYVRDTVV